MPAKAPRHRRARLHPNCWGWLWGFSLTAPVCSGVVLSRETNPPFSACSPASKYGVVSVYGLLMCKRSIGSPAHEYSNCFRSSRLYFMRIGWKLQLVILFRKLWGGGWNSAKYVIDGTLISVICQLASYSVTTDTSRINKLSVQAFLCAIRI